MLTEEEQVYEQAILSKRYADARRVSWNVDDLQNSSKAKRLLEVSKKQRMTAERLLYSRSSLIPFVK